MNTNTQRRLSALGLAGLLGLSLTTAAQAQAASVTVPNPNVTQPPQPVLPADIDRTQFRASARAMGMGGTDLIVAGDASAAAFNPASIAASGQSSFATTVVGRTSNVHVAKINDLSKGLKDVGNQINDNNGSLSAVRDGFAKIYNFATNAGANATTGSPAVLSANAAPLVGVSTKLGQKPDSVRIGVVGYGELGAKVQLIANSIAVPGLTGPTGKVSAAYGVLGLTNVAVPFSIPVKIGALGISPRFIQASYAAAGFLADETSTVNGFDTAVSPTTPNGNITGATYKEVHQSKFDADIGFTSIADPLYHIRGAIVVHNLLSPSFHLPRVINGNSLGVPAGGSFDFTMKPQIDLGGLSNDKGITYAVELHNVNNVNGGKRSFHAGVEYPVARIFSVRVGYDRSRFVAGIGIGTSAFRLDLATGTNPQEQVALGLTFGTR